MLRFYLFAVFRHSLKYYQHIFEGDIEIYWVLMDLIIRSIINQNLYFVNLSHDLICDYIRLIY